MKEDSVNSMDIEQGFGDILITMEKDGSLWLDNPARSHVINMWEYELLALVEFLQRSDVADRLATVRAKLAAQGS